MTRDPDLAHLLQANLGASAFSTDGRRLAVATCAHAEVWDVAELLASGWATGLTDAFLLPFSRMHGVCSASVAFSSDGHTLAVANEGSVTLHDLAVHEVRGTYTLPGTVIGMSFTAGLEHAAFVPDDRALLWQVGASPPQAGDR